MEWYNFLAAFFSGAFLANAVPHFVHGISGDQFPTPFSKPRGKGLSPSTLNVVWSLINLVAGYFLFKAGNVYQYSLMHLICFSGFTVMSLMLSIRFKTKHKS